MPTDGRSFRSFQRTRTSPSQDARSRMPPHHTFSLGSHSTLPRAVASCQRTTETTFTLNAQPLEVTTVSYRMFTQRKSSTRFAASQSCFLEASTAKRTRTVSRHQSTRTEVSSRLRNHFPGSIRGDTVKRQTPCRTSYFRGTGPHPLLHGTVRGLLRYLLFHFIF